jgi:hypothetical protein
MPHARITTISISDPTGTQAPSAGHNGELGRLALENEVIKTLNSTTATSADHNLNVAIDGYYVQTSQPGYIRFSPIIALTVSLGGGGTYEIGQTVSTVNLSWSYNNGNADPDTSQTLNQGIGSLATNLRSYTYSGTITSSTTFSITGIDSLKGSASSSTTISFGRRIYYGITNLATITGTDITGLLSSTLRTSTDPDYDYTYDCTGGYYFVYAYPASWGTLSTTNTKVNGLTFTDWSDNAGGASGTGFTTNVTNSFGHTESYRVYKSYNIQNGSSIPVQFRN